MKLCADPGRLPLDGGGPCPANQKPAASLRDATGNGRPPPAGGGGGWNELADGARRFVSTSLTGKPAPAWPSTPATGCWLHRHTGPDPELDACATCSAADALVRHHEQLAPQAAVTAIAERKGLFIPPTLSPVTGALTARHRCGWKAWTATRPLDVSEDNTSVFWIAGGQNVAIRNLGMTGHTLVSEPPAHTSFRTVTAFLWPTANQQMEVKAARRQILSARNTCFSEDLKVTRMARKRLPAWRRPRRPPAVCPATPCRHAGTREQYTKSCIYHRCHVSDCGFNAFNNNDHAETPAFSIAMSSARPRKMPDGLPALSAITFWTVVLPACIAAPTTRRRSIHPGGDRRQCL